MRPVSLRSKKWGIFILDIKQYYLIPIILFMYTFLSFHMRGGGVVHGPVVRDHSIDLPKKIRALGLKMALSSKAKEDSLIIIDSEKLKAAKTNAFAKQLKKLGLNSALFVGADNLDDNFKKSAANINNVDVLPVIGLNVLDILNHDKLVLTADAVKAVEGRLGA